MAKLARTNELEPYWPGSQMEDLSKELIQMQGQRQDERCYIRELTWGTKTV